MADKFHVMENLGRLKEIANTLSKYEFDDLVNKLKLPKAFLKKKKVTHLTLGQKIRLIFQELGPVYIKFGQVVSCHPDLVPQEIIRELEKLRDKVEPFSFHEVERIILHTFKKPVAELFAEFNPVPLASASIAQVHLARLLTGEKVIVKVQRPDLDKTIRGDLDLLYFLAFLLEKHIPELKRYEITRFVSEFERSIEKEIDFRLEASNYERFRNNFVKSETVHFPKVFHEYSNQFILTTEFIHGAKIDSIIREKDSPHNRLIIAHRGAQAIYKQIFEDGFFHADPHQGNLIIMEKDVICFVDAGMVGYLNPETQNLLANLLVAIVDKNINALISLFMTEGMILENSNLVDLKEDLEDLFTRYYDTNLENIDLAVVLNKFFGLMFKYRIRLPTNFTLLIRCLIILEGIGRQLESNFNPTANMTPYAQGLIKKQYSPVKIVNDFGQFFKENLWIMKSFPNDLLLFVQKVIKGKAEIRLDHQGLDDLNHTLNKASSRLTSGIIIAGMIMASAFIIRSNLPPLIAGFSFLGIAGYLISGLLAVIILREVIKDIK